MATVVITGGSRGIGAEAVGYLLPGAIKCIFYMRRPMRLPRLWQPRPALPPSAVMWQMRRL